MERTIALGAHGAGEPRVTPRSPSVGELRPRNGRGWAVWLAQIALLALAYYGLGQLSMAVAVDAAVTPIWPSTGLAIGALLLFGLRLWPGVAIGATLTLPLTATPFLFLCGNGIAYTLEAFVAAYLLTRVVGIRSTLDRWRDLAALLAVATGVGPLIGATFGVGSLFLAGSASHPFSELWWLWWLADATGALVIVPLLLVWIGTPLPRLPAWRSVELFVLVLGSTAFSYAIFSGRLPHHMEHDAPLYLLFPLATYAALRFRQHGVTLVAAAIATIGAWQTVRGVGPFAGGGLLRSLILLDVFAAVLGLTGLVLAATDAARSRAEEARSRSLDLYRLVVEHSRDLIAMLDDRGRVVYASPSYEALTGYLPPDLRGLEMRSLVHPADRAAADTAFAVSDDAEATAGTLLRIRHRDGHFIPIEEVATHILGEDGKPKMIVVAGRDVSDRFRSEAELREREEHLRFALDAGQMGSWEWTLASEEVRWSENLERIYGLEPGSFGGTHEDFIACVHPDDRELVEAASERAMPGGTFEVVHRVVWPDGTVRWHETKGHAITDGEGRTTGMVGVGSDITERKHADEELRALAVIVESSGEAIFSLTEDLQIRSWNAAAERIFGYAAEEVVGGPVAAIVHEDRVAEVTLIQRLAIGEPVVGVETVQVRKDGTCFDASVTLSPIKNGSGVLTGVSVFIVDISERKHAERERADAEQRFRKLFDEATDVVALLDTDGTIRDSNPALARLTGYPLRELIGKNVLDLVPEAQRELLLEQMRRRLANEVDSVVYEIDLQRADGARAALEIKSTTVREDGEIVGFRAFGRDIGERKELEDQLRQVHKMEAVGQLAGGIAHDFNNLLLVIRGYAELLAGGLDESGRAHKNANQIVQAAEQAALLTRQLLAFSRQQVLQPEAVDLNAALAVMRDMLARLLGDDIEIVETLDEELGHATADPGQLEQILVNLTVNARDAMPAGGTLTIETGNLDLDEESAAQHVGAKPGPYVMLEVRDTGCGMDAETLSHIFDPFFTTKGLEEGTGLGLATVYGIVQQSGGFISVSSEPDVGSAFKIHLPRTESLVAAAHKHVAVSAGTETILLVEDEEIVRDLVRQMLEQLGYSVLVAPDSLSAVALAESEDWALLMTDVLMPKLNGPDLARRLSATRPEMKVLYTSGYAGNAIGERGGLEDGSAFLQKPFTSHQLAAAVRKVLDRAGEGLAA